MIGKLKINQISLGGLELKNDTYMFTVTGLFDHEKTSFESELYSDGSFNPKGKINAKKMALMGYIKTDDFSSHMKLNKVLKNRNQQELKIQIQDNIILKTNVFVSSVSSDDNNIKTCQLVAYDPYLYGEDITLNINLYRSGIVFPLKFPVKFGENSNITNIINNEGTEITYPVIEIKGPCINPSISNITTKEGLIFNRIELFANDTLVIDNRPRTRSIKINGTNRIDLKNGSWISCESGLNEFSFNATSSYDESLCKITIQSRWL